MNKAELIDRIAAGTGLTKAQSGAALNSFIEASKDALKAGDKLTLIGFGTISVSEKSARIGRNPKTGAELNIPAKKVVKFKAGKELAEIVNPAPVAPPAKKKAKK